ncbi:transglycosylase domain-containing protein [Amaricoccus macauensis]|uniref:transglycosylase domain-containing protein n=1 Tax=Amaricoccus macauensis TaxID=57001 RepID=UPI003C7B7360
MAKATNKPKKAPAKRAKPKARARLGAPERMLRGFFSSIFRILWWIGLRAGIAVGLAVGIATAYYYSQLPDFDALLDGRDRGSVTFLDRHNNVFAWRGSQQGLARAEDVSPHLVHAVVATEDRRFYSHFGLDFRGLARAALVNYRAGGTVQGGSSLTQQVAKLIFFDNERTLERKIKEVPAALALEFKFSKNEILSIYLNRAYLGAGATGFQAASERYFGKSAAEVDPSEAAMLAGLLRAPSRFAPTNNLALAQERASTIIDLMEDQGYLTAQQAAVAHASPASLSRAAAERAGGDFADWVMSSGPDFLTRKTTEDISVLTTFDARIQRAAEQALTHVFETKVKPGSKAQAAIVVMSPDGAVRAMVGGRNLGGTEGQFNRATQAKRQTGSLFKTFVFAAALQSGASPLDTVLDAPLTLNVPGSGDWSPRNYSRQYRGDITLDDALTYSVNTATVRVSEATGRARVKALAQDFGVSSPIADGPALALGVSEATLLEMTGAYAGILNGGVAAIPFGMREIQLKEDGTHLMGSGRKPPVRVMNERAAGELVWMMNHVVERGTGTRAKLPDRPAAGKTGTTQAARDAWFIGFTGNYVTGVWMGYDDNTPLSGVTGGGLPAEIWQEAMVRITNGVPAKPLPMRAPEPAAPQVAMPDIRPGQVAQNVGDTVQNVFESVFRGIFGN